MALLLTENSLTPFKVFTLISTLANIKMAVTIFIADSLRCIEDARTTCNRMQHMLEKKFILTHKMDHQQKPSFLYKYSLKLGNTYQMLLELKALEMENQL